MLAIPIGFYQTVPWPGRLLTLFAILTPLLQCTRMDSLTRTVLMFSNIFLFAIRSTIDWLSRRIHMRGTEKLVLLFMVTGVCPSKSQDTQPLTWNWYQMNSLPSLSLLKSAPNVEYTDEVNIE